MFGLDSVFHYSVISVVEIIDLVGSSPLMA